MLLAVFSAFILAILAPTLHRLTRGLSGWIFALVPAAIAAFYASHFGKISSGEVITQTINWIPSLGIHLAFRLDGLSLLFGLLISGIGALIFIYAGGYLHGHPQLGRFFCFLSFFMGAMLGLVTSDNLLSLFIFWELTSLSSYLLIGFNHESEESRASALKALLVTFFGGQALMLGLILIGIAGQTYSLSELLNNADIVRESPLYTGALLLVILGAFTKSAQVPFHFWLPGAMAAPTPVSAYLHSATMVTAGVFLLARLQPILGGSPLWHGLLTTFGAATMLTGAALAVAQTDLKKLLAYTTVSALGTLVMLLGIGTPLAIQAAALFLIVHSLYKGSLFMVAGTIDHETGTRDVRQLGGLAKAMPITALAAGLAALSMCGFIPALGFIGKELLYEAALHAPQHSGLLVIVSVFGNALVVAVGLIVAVRPFLGKAGETPKHAHEAPPSLWLGPIVLATLGLLLGLLPFLAAQYSVGPAASAIAGQTLPTKLSLWHGFNVMLGLSAATLVIGVALYFSRNSLRELGGLMRPLAAFGPEQWYAKSLNSMVTFAGIQTRIQQHGYLRYYVMMVLAVTTLAIVLGLSRSEIHAGWANLADVRFYEVLIGVIILAAGLYAVTTRGRLSAVAGLGVVGWSVALIFALYGAPDLAITQFMVETLSLILFILVIYHLPRFKEYTDRKTRIRDAILCSAAGVAIAVMVMKALGTDSVQSISPYYVENSLNAQGRNIVNVILVDFRALDTLGEITVLGIAALGVYALIKLRPKPEPEPEPETQSTKEETK
ncbi:putative monovalent cation/H+ antiporter subunit A [Phragmitibacter flavus]|uniref:Putative monovalent cation/H+ antiporter subunit A n=1 Tax=Phragmitibacter flavus TaxID=2576071 RepID=A0A5R8KA17_9BACT|nr:putative monovalent cation/H+ antiporter subunit A [Phragmitibacter flavus]TLD69163.1 putative monovalent cation/H+ antiporter subunit A [Phragmitibacter flavus]